MRDACMERPILAGGSVELGLGHPFMPVVSGQDVDLQFGPQGLWMFVVNARTCDMDVGTGDREGAIEATALDRSGQQISIPLGCRVREFVETSDGCLQTTSSYLLPLRPDVPLSADGTPVTIHLELHDVDGHRATDERSVVAYVPGA
jgi:hypothetical protein